MSSNTGIQGLLFGSLSVEANESTSDELTLCALNLQSPTVERVERQVMWLSELRADVLVLSELRNTEGGRRAVALLDADGYTIVMSPEWHQSDYFTLVASRPRVSCTAGRRSFNPRVVSVHLAYKSLNIELVGIYGMTNGMTAESSARRRAFQRELIDWLHASEAQAMCVTGDLNVVEPDHVPRIESFESHDYEFYEALTRMGLRDEYRASRIGPIEHSWYSPLHGGQRLDHMFLTQAGPAPTRCWFDHSVRNQKLSDHSALMATLVAESE